MEEFVVLKRRKENFTIEKRGRPSDIKVGIFMPMPYNAALSSLFFQMAYTYINSLEGVIAYRYVFNLEEKRVEALDEKLSPRKLDLLLISLPFELDYVTTTYTLLHLNLLKRVKSSEKPIVVAGGIAPTANPLPLSDIVDAVVIGEAEEVLENLVYRAGEPSAIKAVSELSCVLTSSFNEVKRKCFVENLNKAPHPIHQFYSHEEEPVYGYGIRVEVSRGCPYLCAFCMESHVMYPFRYRDVTVLKEIIEKGVEFLKVRRAVLYSLSLFSVPSMDKLLNKLLEQGVEASVPSIRVEHATRERLELIKALGQRTLTIAPETLLQAHSCKIGKCYMVDSLLESLSYAYKIGFNHVKLYLITGFPGVSVEEELKHFENFISSLKSIRRRDFVEITLNPLIPKPWTPYQFLPPMSVLKNRHTLEQYKRIAKGGNVKLITLDVEWAFAQAVIALGDKSVSKLIIEWALNGIGLKGFKKALQLASNEVKNYVKNGWRDPPWYRCVDLGIPKLYLDLRARYLSAL
jgi:radical SAM superfamily enzyme YgiQ (UPF0313 family)